MKTTLNQWINEPWSSRLVYWACWHCPRHVLMLLTLLWLPVTPNLRAQSVPHHFDGIAALPDRTITLRLDGSISNMFNVSGTISNQVRQMFDLYVVEASTNLADWTRLAVLPRTNSDPNPLCFQDTNAAGLSQRFYRTFTNHLVTGFPKPSGGFAVGTFNRVLTDPSRSNRYGLTTNSSFMSTFWYPAAPSTAGILPGAVTEPAVAGDRGLYLFWSFPLPWTNVMLRCVGHGVPGLTVVPGTNRFPVILHSHGWTCDRKFNSQTAEELASHGYIVAAVDHEDCHVTVFPDSRGTRYVSPGSRNDAGLSPSRLKDLQCLLDELNTIDDSDPLLAGRVDLDHVGVMGFSLGGGTAAETCRVDDRIKCAALLDPFVMFSYYPPDLYSKGLQKPLLAMNRTILDHSDRLWDSSPDSQRLYNLATTNATWLKITNTGHFAFSDCAWAVEMTASSRSGAVAINACLVWFFDTYLKGEAPAFPLNPEIINLQQK